MLGYTLTNSHHSMDFKINESVTIEELFKDIGKISPAPIHNISIPNDSWEMNLDRKPLLGQSSRLRIKQGIRLHDTTGLARSLRRMNSIPRPLTTIDDELRDVSQRINNLASILQE